MANICCCYVTIDTDDDQYDAQLDELYQRIDHQNKALLKVMPYLERDGSYGLVSAGLVSANQDEEGTIHLDFSCKNSPPDEELIALSKLYPHLKLSIVAEEPGNNLYMEQEYSGGVKQSEKYLSCVAYLTKNNPEFTKEKKYVERLSSKKAVEYILDSAELEDPRFNDLLEPIALKRVTDADLPLLINHQWLTTNANDAEATYKSRLAKATI